MTQRVEVAWGEGKLTGMLLKDVKEAFDNVRRNGLMRKIEI